MPATPANPHGVPQAEWDTPYAAAMLGDRLADDMRAIAADGDVSSLWPRVRATLGQLRALLLVIAVCVSATATLAHPNTADGAARHIDSACGVHRGHLVIAGGVDHRYHVRIGPKRTAGRARCHGRVHRHTATASLGGSWFSLDLGAWSWRGILDVGATTVFTASACSTFAAAMIGEIPSGGIDSAATVITGAACVAGGKRLQDTIRTHIRPQG